MKKKSHGDVRCRLAQHLRQQQEVIIVNPYEVVWTKVLQYLIAKDLVHANVSVPMFGSKSQQGRKVMKERPQRLVCYSFVETVRCFRVEIDGKVAMFFGPLLDYRAPFVIVRTGSFT